MLKKLEIEKTENGTYRLTFIFEIHEIGRFAAIELADLKDEYIPTIAINIANCLTTAYDLVAFEIELLIKEIESLLVEEFSKQ